MAYSENGKRPRWQRLSERHRKMFLDHVRDGMLRSEAAMMVAAETDAGWITGTVVRSLCRNDPAFDAAYQQALAAGRAGIVDGLRAELVRRALDVERMNSRELHNALILYDREYREAHQRQRVEHTGPGGGALEVMLDDSGRAQLVEKLDRLLVAGREAADMAADPV